jgi:hypothetical protein
MGWVNCNNSTYSGNNVKIRGDNNRISGNNLEIAGDNNRISGNNLTVKGDNNRVSGNNITVKGDNNNVSGVNVNAIGNNNSSNGQSGSSSKKSESVGWSPWNVFGGNIFSGNSRSFFSNQDNVISDTNITGQNINGNIVIGGMSFGSSSRNQPQKSGTGVGSIQVFNNGNASIVVNGHYTSSTIAENVQKIEFTGSGDISVNGIQDAFSSGDSVIIDTVDGSIISDSRTINYPANTTNSTSSVRVNKINTVSTSNETVIPDVPDEKCDDERDQCPVCMENKAIACYVDCGHFTCFECAKNMKKEKKIIQCPVCKTDVSRIIRTFKN